MSEKRKRYLLDKEDPTRPPRAIAIIIGWRKATGNRGDLRR
jgi:hypothetical protein